MFKNEQANKFINLLRNAGFRVTLSFMSKGETHDLALIFIIDKFNSNTNAVINLFPNGYEFFLPTQNNKIGADILAVTRTLIAKG